MLERLQWLFLVIWVLLGIYLYSEKDTITTSTDPGAMFVSATCITDGRGVTRCVDSKTGRTWTINPSPVGTTIRG